jgi:hypothetical protein
MVDEEIDRLDPDEAFGVLGNEIRIDILRTLGEAGEPLSFSSLYDRVAVDDSGRFNYHLERTVGHFVRKTDEGYTLGRPGRRVVETVLSGAVTGSTEFPRTAVDQACPHCGAPVRVQWRAGSVEKFCTSCAGEYGQSYNDDRTSRAVEDGYLGRHPLPPAGLEGRGADETVRAAWTWGNLEILSLASSICPRCSAPVDHGLTVCESHEADRGRCPNCDRRFAVVVRFECTNCILAVGGTLVIALAANTDLLSFLTDHGRNPVNPDPIGRVEAVHNDHEEEVRSTDPFEARVTFEIDDERLSLTVDEDLTVVDATRRSD